MVIDTALVALIIALALFVIALAVFLVLLHRSRVASPVEKPEPVPAKQDQSASIVRDAVAALRHKVPGGRFDQRVPWNLIIGETASGKTVLADHLGSGSSVLPVSAGEVQWSFPDGGALI